MTPERSTAVGGATATAIRHHYDIGNDFYGLWLDERLVYSCALWEDHDDLEQAQVRKLDWMLDGAQARGTANLLDIGCGWGALMGRALEGGVEHTVGLTLSDEQARAVAGLGDPRMEVRVEHWADHTPQAPYDAIISVGAFEHFADLGMRRAEKVESYREFFSRCRQWLRPGGRMALQTVAKGNARKDVQAVKDGQFIYERIFRQTDIPWLSELLQASENRFEPVEVRLDPGHYIRTLQEWRSRLSANREKAVEIVPGEVLEDYERYLVVAERYFAQQHATLARVILRRA